MKLKGILKILLVSLLVAGCSEFVEHHYKPDLSGIDSLNKEYYTKVITLNDECNNKVDTLYSQLKINQKSLFESLVNRYDEIKKYMDSIVRANTYPVNTVNQTAIYLDSNATADIKDNIIIYDNRDSTSNDTLYIETENDSCIFRVKIWRDGEWSEIINKD